MPSPRFPVSTIDDPLRVSGKYFRAGEEVCLIKAVAFGSFPAGAFPDEGRSELRRIRERLGANAIRIDEIPSLDFMHECAEVGLRVFMAIPWEQNLDFVSEKGVIEKAEQLLLETIGRFRGHPAVGGYFVANEIDVSLVRWMGVRHVIDQLERLIDLGHEGAPGTLFAYANGPGTESVLPQNQDFAAFNLYAESRKSVAASLARLQNLAGDKPLLISRFGADSRALDESGQAEMLRWYLDEACSAGVAGSTLFAWSDLRQISGETLESHDFGLTRRDHTEKPALEVVRDAWSQLQRPSDFFSLEKTPRVSVIVCTNKGSATLVPCLDSLVAMTYPDFEVILVNDGDDTRVSEIAGTYESIKHLAIEHAGLSSARNTGAGAATGEIFVYTDDDCVAEPDWLKWIVKLFSQDASLGCAGGPNIAPKPETRTQAMITAAPGGASQVLLSDTRAEYLPGCNLAIRRPVFEELGGFNPVFRSAGGDVDFCWRASDAGYALGFHPLAFVWHQRRFSYQAYFRQQIGHGRAEAFLLPIHRDRFCGLSGAVWEGDLYSARRRIGRVTSFGRFGNGPIKISYSAYKLGQSGTFLHILWWAAALSFALGSLFLPILLLPMTLMVLTTLYAALGRAGRSSMEQEFDTTSARVALAGLIVVQGAMRSGARLLWGWRSVDWAGNMKEFGRSALGSLTSGWWKLGDEKEFTSNDGIGREELLQNILANFEGAKVDATGKTDIVVKKGRFWSWAVVTVTEQHAQDVRLTRLRVLARPQWVTRITVLPLLIIIPVAVMIGFGFHSELLILTVLYGMVWGAAKVFMRVGRPHFTRAALSVGLKPL